MSIRCVFFVLAFFVVFFYGLGRFESTSQSLMHVIRRLDEKITTVELVEFEKQRATLKLKKFVWDTCSGPDALARINELDISDPLSIPGDITMTVDLVLCEDVQSPLKVAVRVQKKVGFFWIDIPCIDNVGSCNYEDICALIPFKPAGEPCPEPFLSLKLPCDCPFPQGNYVVKKFLVQIPDEHIPEFLLGGEYSVRVQASMNSQEVICFKSEFVIV